MGWTFLAADAPPSDGSSQSITVALIVTLGTVLVALVTLAGQWISSRTRTAPAPTEPAVHIGERVVATEIRTADNARTLDVLDRHVDGLDDRVDGHASRLDKQQWQIDDLLAWRDEHRRSHGSL